MDGDGSEYQLVCQLKCLTDSNSLQYSVMQSTIVGYTIIGLKLYDIQIQFCAQCYYFMLSL